MHASILSAPVQGTREQEIEVGYRLLLPVVHVGGLIGRGGEAIADIRHRTHARVKVHDAHDSKQLIPLVRPKLRSLMRMVVCSSCVQASLAEQYLAAYS